jgi:GGDEF domain-containing protein
MNRSNNNNDSGNDTSAGGVRLSIKDPALSEIVEITLRLEGIPLLDEEKSTPSLIVSDPDGFNSTESNLSEIIQKLLLVENEDQIVDGIEYLVIPRSGGELDIDPNLLVRKVNHMLAGHRPAPEKNPVTGLPGEPAFESELRDRIDSGERFGILVADINQLKDYNRGYSYARGDRMLQALGDLMNKVMNRHAHPQNFLSHIGSDEFAIITSENLAPGMAEEIVDEFDEMVAEFYDVADLARGHLIISDRKGNETRAPIATIAIAAILSSKRKLSHPAEAMDVAEELIKVLKSRDITESCCIVERPDQ